jgi:CheY-like chemotaxis protein
MEFAPSSVEPTSVASASPTVLVVDDDRAVIEALTEMLESDGYDVVAARDGIAALNRLRSGLRPSVILLDLMMPRMDGWDFRQQQLKDEDLKDIPVVVITAAGFSEASVRTQFGDIEFVPKPPPANALLAAVRRCCGELHTER